MRECPLREPVSPRVEDGVLLHPRAVCLADRVADGDWPTRLKPSAALDQPRRGSRASPGTTRRAPSPRLPPPLHRSHDGVHIRRRPSAAPTLVGVLWVDERPHVRDPERAEELLALRRGEPVILVLHVVLADDGGHLPSFWSARRSFAHRSRDTVRRLYSTCPTSEKTPLARALRECPPSTGPTLSATLFVVELVRPRARRSAIRVVVPFRPACEAGLERATPTFDEAPARVDQRYDEHRRHDCADEEAQLGSSARAFATAPRRPRRERR